MGRLPHRRYLLLALAITALLTTGHVVAQQGCPLASPSGQLSLSAQLRAENALVADVTVQQAAAGPIYLEYGNSEVGWLRTPAVDADPLLQLPLVRLRPSTTYQVRAFSLGSAGCAQSVAQTEMRTGELPSQLQRLLVESTGRPSFPLALMDVQVDEGDSRWLVALDEAEQIVWYYQVPRAILRAQPGRGVNAIIQRANGNLLYIARQFGVEEITPDGRSVRRVRMEVEGIHHDMVELPDGRLLTFGAEARVIDDTPNGGPADQHVLGDTLYVLDMVARQADLVWSAFDTFDPVQRPAQWQGRREGRVIDWTHGNSINIGPRGNVILSFRHLDEVISLTPDLQSVEWRLGGQDSSFTFPDPSDRFYGQHTVVELPGNRLLMFDNGNFRPEDEYSRALELQLDFDSMTARKVWEYRHDPDIFASQQSNAERLPNGNTLVNFGFPSSPDEPVTLTEARPDGTVSWDMTARLQGQRTIRYRAYATSGLAGEMAVEPTPIADRGEAGRV